MPASGHGVSGERKGGRKAGQAWKAGGARGCPLLRRGAAGSGFSGSGRMKAGA
jgi:hypothetical protein